MDPGPPPSRMFLRVSDTAKHSMPFRDITLMKAKRRVREIVLVYKRVIQHADQHILREYAAFIALPRPTALEIAELRPRFPFQEQRQVYRLMIDAHRSSVHLADRYGHLPLCGELALLRTLVTKPEPHVRRRALLQEQLQVLHHMKAAHKSSVHLVESYRYLPLCGELTPLLTQLTVPEPSRGPFYNVKDPSPTLQSTKPREIEIQVTEVDDDQVSAEDEEDLAPLTRVAVHSGSNPDNKAPFVTEEFNEPKVNEHAGQTRRPLPGHRPAPSDTLRSRDDHLVPGLFATQTATCSSLLQGMDPPGQGRCGMAEEEPYDPMDLDTKEPVDMAALPEDDDSSDWETESDHKGGIYVDPEFHPLTIPVIDDKFEVFKRNLKDFDWRQETWDLHRLLAEYHYEESFHVESPRLEVQLDVLVVLRAWIEKYTEFLVYLHTSCGNMRDATVKRRGRSFMAYFGSDLGHLILSRGEGSPLTQSVSIEEVDNLMEEESWGGARSRPPRPRLLGSIGTPVMRPVTLSDVGSPGSSFAINL